MFSQVQQSESSVVPSRKRDGTLGRLFQIALFVVLSTHLGCASLERVEECGAVVSLVNESLDHIAGLQPDAGVSGAKRYKQIAQEYEQLGQSLRGLALLDRDLRKAVASYAAVPEQAAVRSKAYAEQLSRRRSGSAKKRRQENKKLAGIAQSAKADLRREASATRQLNDVCRPR